MLKTKIMAMYLNAIAEAERILKGERGDTNFISILIVLAIVVILVGIFIGFKDTIVSTVTDIVSKFEIH